MTSDAEIAQPVVEQLVAAVQVLGLPADDPVVLSVGANIVVHLRPSPVVARVATLTADMRGDASGYLMRERDVTSALAQNGINVITVTDAVDPGPHLAGEHPFLLLEHTEIERIDVDSQVHAEHVGRSLAELTTALASLPAHLATGDEGQPWAEMATMLAVTRPATTPGAVQRIEAVIAELQSTEPDDPWQLVHGDAHRNNVGMRNGEVIWFDFEDANLRPLAWDATTLLRAWPHAGQVTCNLLGIDAQSPSMRWHFELREVYALLWNLLYAQTYERARTGSAERLAGWLEQH